MNVDNSDPNTEDKAALRRDIEKDIEIFLKNKGSIEKIGIGVHKDDADMSVNNGLMDKRSLSKGGKASQRSRLNKGK